MVQKNAQLTSGIYIQIIFLHVHVYSPGLGHSRRWHNSLTQRAASKLLFVLNSDKAWILSTIFTGLFGCNLVKKTQVKFLAMWLTLKNIPLILHTTLQLTLYITALL